MTSHSGATAQPRALRGRLMVVGGTLAAREFAALARKFVPAVSEVPSVYAALVDVAASTAREPIAAIAISSDAEEFDAEEICQAFSLADSSVPVVLLFPHDDIDMEAIGVAAGFEDLIPLPAAADDVTRVFTELGLIDAPRDRGTPKPPNTQPHTSPSIPLPSQVVDIHVKRALAQVHPESDPEFAPSASSAAGTEPTATTPPVPTVLQSPTKPQRTEASAAHPLEQHEQKLGRQIEQHVAQNPNTAEQHRTDRTTTAPPKQRVSAQASTLANTPSPVAPPTQVARRRRTDGHPQLAQSRPPQLPTAAEVANPKSAKDPSDEHPPNEDPSDLDLLRAIRQGRELLPVALTVLRSLLQCNDVRYAAPTRPSEEHLVRDERAHLHVAPIRGETSLHGELLSAACDPALLTDWAAWLAEWLDFEQLHLMQRKLVWSDDLTGAGNRRALYDFAPRALQQAREERRHVSLMVFDIDNFKQYNDAYGHETGDEVLRETVAVMRECIRPGDHVFRLGGDEFVVLFCDPASGAGPHGVPESVPAIAERCRAKLASTRTPIEILGRPGPGSITLSAGCATFPWDGGTLEELLRCADTRAMQAKRDGKNLINFGPDSPPVP